MRKILGVLNIVAGVSILASDIWLFAPFLRETRGFIYLVAALLVAGTSLASGIFVLKEKKMVLSILASINLILAGYVLILLVLGGLFALFD